MKDKLYIIGMLVLILIGLCLFCLIVYTLYKYRNTPVSEVPLWAWWLLKNK